MVKIFPAANSHEGGLDMAPGGHVTRSERSEARASRRAELKPCLDAGGNRLSTSSERLAAQRALRGGRRAPARRARRSHRRALRRRTLARELCRVSHNAARYPKIRSRSFSWLATARESLGLALAKWRPAAEGRFGSVAA